MLVITIDFNPGDDLNRIEALKPLQNDTETKHWLQKFY